MITSDHLIQRPRRSPVAAYQWPRRERTPGLLARLLWQHRHPAGATVPAVTLRLATVADAHAIERLAALDSATAPAGPVLLAEVDGTIRAALALSGGATIADPFFPSAALVPLLRARALQLPSGGATGVDRASGDAAARGLTPACC